MLESLGARLRQRREAQEIALLTVANQTKIKLSLLEGLERDDVSHWPSGFYSRAFIRAYAHAIGLNPDVVVREFLDAHPELPEMVATTPAAELEAEAARMNGGPPTRLRYIVGSAMGSLSRLRRSHTSEDLPVAEGAPLDVPPLDMPDPPSAPSSPGPEIGRVERTREVAASSPRTNETASTDPDFQAVARLCTELGRVENTDDVQPLLDEIVSILGAVGLIVWIWDALAAELRPVLASGYSDKVLAQLPAVTRDADNPTAAAFRSARACATSGREQASGALVVPLLTPAGCAGVLALELQPGGEQTSSFLRSAAAIFAALLAQLVGGASSPEVQAEMIAAVRSG